MAIVTWTLQYLTTTQSLAAWGIIEPRLSRFNLATESLSFSLPAGALGEPVFPLNATLTLRRVEDGTPVIWFIGRVRVRQVHFGEQVRTVYTVRNAWANVSRITYQQQYTVPNTDNTALLGSWSTRVVLGQNQFGTKITASQQITSIGYYANAVGGNLITLAALGALAAPLLETVRDISCAEAIRRMLAYAPDAVGRFDYASGATVLTIQRHSALTLVSIDLADKNRVESGQLAEIEDMDVPGVSLVFLHEADVGGVSVLRETRQSAGSLAEPGVIRATITLAQGESVPADLAAQYYTAIQGLYWQGGIRYRERDCSGLLRPGVKVNLLGGLAAWATAGVIVQATVEHLDSGLTEVALGSPEHLDLGTFVDMLTRFARRLPAGSFALTQHNGTDGVDDQVPGSDPGNLGTDPAAGGAVGGDPAVPPASQTPNPSGGSSYGVVSGQTATIPVCVDGVEQQIKVFRAP